MGQRHSLEVYTVLLIPGGIERSGYGAGAEGAATQGYDGVGVGQAVGIGGSQISRPQKLHNQHSSVSLSQKGPAGVETVVRRQHTPSEVFTSIGALES